MKKISIFGAIIVAALGLIFTLRDEPMQNQTLKIDSVVSESERPEAGYRWDPKADKYEKLDVKNNINP